MGRGRRQPSQMPEAVPKQCPGPRWRRPADRPFRGQASRGREGQNLPDTQHIHVGDTVDMGKDTDTNMKPMRNGGEAVSLSNGISQHAITGRSTGKVTS